MTTGTGVYRYLAGCHPRLLPKPSPQAQPDPTLGDITELLESFELHVEDTGQQVTFPIPEEEGRSSPHVEPGDVVGELIVTLERDLGGAAHVRANRRSTVEATSVVRLRLVEALIEKAGRSHEAIRRTAGESVDDDS